MHLLDRFFPVILIFLLLSLAVAIVFGVLHRTETGVESRGSVQRKQDDGASKLGAWLSELGYEVRTLTQSPLSPAPTDRVLFVLAPNGAFTTIELARLANWVRAGGTLIVAQDTKRPGQLLAYYQMALAPLAQPVKRAALRLPALNWPPVGQVWMRAAYKLRLQRQDAAIHIGDCDTPLLVSFGMEEGQIFVLPTIYPLTNHGLQDVSNARLVHNLVRASAPPGGRIAFDEAHHRKPTTPISLTWLFTKPEGWGFLYAVAVLFGYLLLSGQRFGSLAPWPGQNGDHTMAAFSQTATDLSMLTGIQSVIQCYYWERLKADLSRKYHLDPTLSDGAFLSALRRHRNRNKINLVALTRLQSAPGREVMSKEALVRWTKEIIEWRQNLNTHVSVRSKEMGLWQKT